MDSCARTTKQGEEEEDQVSAYAFQLASSSVMPMVLQAAVELEVLEIIAKAGPAAQLSAAEIASQMGAAQNPDAPSMLDRMLRILVSFSVLTCSLRGTTRIYGLAPVAKYYVRNQNGASFGPLISLIQDKVFMDSWSSLPLVVLFVTFVGGLAALHFVTHSKSSRLPHKSSSCTLASSPLLPKPQYALATNGN